MERNSREDEENRRAPFLVSLEFVSSERKNLSGTTVLYDLASGDSLGELEAGVHAVTPDGRLLFMLELTGDPAVDSLVAWDTQTLASQLIEVDFDWSFPVVIAPDVRSAVFVVQRGSDYQLERVKLDDFSLTTLATAANFTHFPVSSADGKLAFYASGELRVAPADDSPVVTLSSRLNFEAKLAWLGTDTVVSELAGPYQVQQGVYALAALPRSP